MADQNLPTPGAYVDDALVLLYGTTIDQLIADFGREITLYLPPTTSGCPNCKMGFGEESQGVPESSNPYPVGSPFNKPFATGGLCPVCQGTHKIETPNSVVYKASIQRTPKDLEYAQYGVEFDPRNVVKTKTKLATFEDFKIATKALIDGDMYVRIREPVKTGLRDLRYVQCWWKRADL